MATIKDISKALHVSVSTVSMALNDSKEISEKTKLRVRETAVAMNYVRNGSAVNLQRKKTNTILFITDNPTRPSSRTPCGYCRTRLQKKALI